MKKLITLLIVLICCVGTVGASSTVKLIGSYNNWGEATYTFTSSDDNHFILWIKGSDLFANAVGGKAYFRPTVDGVNKGPNSDASLQEYNYADFSGSSAFYITAPSGATDNSIYCIEYYKEYSGKNLIYVSGFTNFYLDIDNGNVTTYPFTISSCMSNTPVCTLSTTSATLFNGANSKNLSVWISFTKMYTGSSSNSYHIQPGTSVNTYNDFTVTLSSANNNTDKYIILGDNSTDGNYTINYTSNSGDYNNGTLGVEYASSTYKLYVQNKSNNTVPKLHRWIEDNSVLNGTYPGNEMTAETIFGETWYYYSTTSKAIKAIISLSGDDNKTDDLTIDFSNGNVYYYFYPENGTQSERISQVEPVITNAYGYATFTNNYPLTISDATAYYATDNGNGSATATAITNPAANTPMLIKGDASTTYYFAVAASGTDYSSTNAFHAGSGSALDANDGGGVNYILKGDTFYKANGNVVATNKAYLKLSKEASARALIFPGDDDETTNINLNVNENLNSVAPMYNIAGQRVANNYKGIVIQNGKKYVVK